MSARHRVRHLFSNLPHRAGDRPVTAYLDAHSPHVDVWAFAEGGWLIPKLRRLTDFDVVEPFPRCPTPLMFRRELFTLRGVSWRHITPATPVGSAGAGPRVMAEKRISTALLEHNPSGAWWAFNTFHAVPSIYLDVRDELHEQQMAGLAGEVDAQRADVVLLSGDFNTEPDNPNMRALDGLTLDSDPAVPTHGSRTIDLTYRRGTLPGLDVVAKVVPGVLADDHDAQRTAYRWDQ